MNQCEKQTHAADMWQPAEFCDDDPIPGTDFCANHTDDRDWDAIRDWSNEQKLGATP